MSLATISRTMRSRVNGRCRRICTCCLSLIRRVHICMCFTPNWSVREDSNFVGLAPKASGQPMTHTRISGHASVNCTHLARVATECIASLPWREVGWIGGTRTRYSRFTVDELGYFAFDPHRIGAPSRT